MARKLKTQVVGVFRYAEKSYEVAIENAVHEMGRIEDAKRWYLEG